MTSFHNLTKKGERNEQEKGKLASSKPPLVGRRQHTTEHLVGFRGCSPPLAWFVSKLHAGGNRSNHQRGMARPRVCIYRKKEVIQSMRVRNTRALIPAIVACGDLLAPARVYTKEVEGR